MTSRSTSAALRPAALLLASALCIVLFIFLAGEVRAVDTASSPSVRMTVPDASPSSPTVTARARLDSLPASFPRTVKAVWYVDGMAYRTVSALRVCPGTEISCRISYVFGPETAEASEIVLELSAGPKIWRFRTETALNNYSASYYELQSSRSLPYRIDVIRDRNTVLVWGADSEGAYTLLQNVFACSTGSWTPTGYFSLGGKSRWRALFADGVPSTNYVYGQYVTTIDENILFHSVPYLTMNTDDLEYDEFNRLGTSASAGCVRLTSAAAKWIWDNCPAGTSVHIYNADSLPEGILLPTAPRIDPDSSVRGWDPTDPDAPCASFPDAVSVPG